MEQNLLPVDLNVCMAIHAGYVTVTGDRGCIHSEVINFVSHLEKYNPLAPPLSPFVRGDYVSKNSICISDDVFGELSEQVKKRFSPRGVFEGKEIYIYQG